MRTVNKTCPTTADTGEQRYTVHTATSPQCNEHPDVFSDLLEPWS
jgi:hypothetical protein